MTEPELRPATDYAREPDAFGRLWTPHRMAYILGEGKPPDADAGAECPFCRAPTLSDEDGLIVARGQLGYAVLNLYPYNSGHLMSVPYRHVADYTDLTPDEVSEVANITRTAMRVLRKFRSTRSAPAASTIRAASAIEPGSDPKSWIASGCSSAATRR